MRALRVLAAIVAALGVLAAWRFTFPVSCAALAAPAAVLILVGLGLRESGVARRRFFASFYFKDGTWLRALFSRTLLVSILAFLTATIPVAALCLDLTTWSPNELALLAANAVVLLVLMRMFEALLRSGAEPAILPVLVKRWSVAVNTLLLLAGLAMVRLYTPAPAYVDPSLVVMIETASAQLGSDCAWIDAALQLQIGKEALGWWLIGWSEGRLGGGEAEYLRWLAWILFLVSGSFSAFAYSWFLAHIMHLADHAGAPQRG
ncbi:MAG: hypothetical protein AAGM38_03280 [Pseudomonadota bacterium]